MSNFFYGKPIPVDRARTGCGGQDVRGSGMLFRGSVDSPAPSCQKGEKNNDCINAGNQDRQAHADSS